MGGQRHLQRTAKCHTVQRSDHWLFAVIQRLEDMRQGRRDICLAKIPDVSACGEKPPLAIEHDGTHGRIALEGLEPLVDRRAQRQPDGIDGRLGKPDQPDLPFRLNNHQFVDVVFHGLCPFPVHFNRSMITAMP